MEPQVHQGTRLQCLPHHWKKGLSMNKIYYISPKEIKPIKVTLLDAFFDREIIEDTNPINNNTVTRAVKNYSNPDNFDVEKFTEALKTFNLGTETLRTVPRKKLYRHFEIPKKQGGKMRPIDAPEPELHAALTMLKALFENHCGAYLHHTAAFAYVKQRCTVDLVKVHQKNKSRWFLHLDFSNFFGSTTMKFVMNMFARIYPFNMAVSNEECKAELEKALELCFLNGGLPQGTPMSPWLTNVMMIPIDHELMKRCAHFFPHLIYTRYADDLVISSEYDFEYKNVERMVNNVLHSFEAPFLIKPEKTHYKSSSGKNWILGVMLNKDNNITIGHQNKKYLKARICSYINDTKAGNFWDLEDVYEFYGKIAYYRMIEPEAIKEIINKNNIKFRVDVEALIKSQLKGELA